MQCTPLINLSIIRGDNVVLGIAPHPTPPAPVPCTIDPPTRDWTPRDQHWFYLFLCEQLFSALTRDEFCVHHSSNYYSAILCFSHCAGVMPLNELLALHIAFWISTEVVTTLFSCYMVPWETPAVSVQALCTPCTSLQCHLILSHSRMVHECIAVSGHLRFGRMARIFHMLL